MSRPGAAWGAFAVGVLAVSFVAAAHSEVWPLPGDALVRGPWALLDESATSVWANPAAARPARDVAIGVVQHVAFDLEEWARLDAAAAVRIGRAYAAAGWTRFGDGELATSGTAAGGGAPIGGDRLRAGVWVRRHERHGDAAWGGDFGLLAVPSPKLRVAAVLRSALRGGEPAPDAEWELAAAWDEPGGGVAAAVARDVSGPLAVRAAMRLALGALQTHASLSRLEGGETRAGLAIVAALPGGIGFSAAREVGPRLPDSRAVALEWNPPSTPPAAARSISHAEDAAAKDDLEVDPEQEAALERAHREIEQREEEETRFEALPRSATPREPPSSNATIGARGDGPRPVGASGELRTAAIGGPRSALAWHGVGAVSWGLSPTLALLGAAAFSKDAGEPRSIDESRLSVSLSRRRSWTILAGDLDARIGTGLVVDAPLPGGRGGLRLEPAARVGRAPLPAARGGALLWSPGGAWRAGAFALRTARDAHEIGGAWAPIGGRYHRSALEIARRGGLAEQLVGMGLGIGPAAGSEASVSMVRAQYSPARRLPGGELSREARWIVLHGETSIGGARIGSEASLSSCGRAIALDTKRALRRGALASVSLRWRMQSDGYAPATAWPGSAIGERWETTIRWRPPRPLHALVLRGLDERWSAPSAAAATDRHGWRREVELAAGARRWTMDLGVECGWQESRREASGAAARYGDATSDGWWVTRLVWPATPVYRVGLAARASRRGGLWHEQWTLSGARRLPGSIARVELIFRPGSAASASALDTDPLGGLVLERSTSPSRCTLEFARALGPGRSAPSLGARVTARSLATSESPRVAVWSWIGSGGARDALPDD